MGFEQRCHQNEKGEFWIHWERQIPGQNGEQEKANKLVSK